MSAARRDQNEASAFEIWTDRTMAFRTMALRMSFSGLREVWAGLSAIRKFFWLAALIFLLALAAVLLWTNLAQRDYRMLFAGLSDKDGGQVVAALEKLRIPYQLGEPGGAIEVPFDQLHVARYKLAVQGLPKGDRSADEPPAMRFGMSSFQEQLEYQRRLEAELAHSIISIAGIESARVHLALPKQSSFLREPVLPSASVLLKLKSGVFLNAQQIEAVRLIVSGSVPGMAVWQVNVLDQRGVMLSSTQTVMTATQNDTPPAMPALAMQQKIAQAAPVQLPAPQSGSAAPTQYREILLGLLLALLAAWLLVRLRGHQSPAAPERHAKAEANAQNQAAHDFEAQLIGLRQRVSADPRLAASVLKLWMQQR